MTGPETLTTPVAPAPALPIVPAAGGNVSAMAMAFDLVKSGADFASVKEMLDYSRQIEREAAEAAFFKAMAAAQGEMEMVATNASNPQTRSRYADYAQLDRALRPIYRKHGFALSFNDGFTDKPDWVRIECYVSHVAGHKLTYHKDMPADGKGAKGNDVMTKTHAVGAAQSYAMRYLLRMIFNVAVGEKDTDGNMPGDVITSEQRDRILALAEEVGADLPKFCAYFKIEAVADLPAAMFDRAVKSLEAKRAQK
jgi:hypothetical protein